MTRPERWGGALAVCAAVALGGCVQREYREARSAQAAYERCLELAGDDVAACARESDAYGRAVDRYERAARRSWGCDPAQAECPTRR